MGNFRIVIDAVGGHGCERDSKDGEKVFGCRRQTCPDCVAQEFFDKMTKIASNVTGSITHWPGDPSQVIDEFQPEKHTVDSYIPSKWVQNEQIDGTVAAGGKYVQDPDAKEVHYVSTFPSHRIRRGSFKS